MADKEGCQMMAIHHMIFYFAGQKKNSNFSNLGVSFCLLFFFHCFFFIISNTIYPSSHTHCGYISSWAFGKSKYPACALLSDVIFSGQQNKIWACGF
jgi:hypothetical protein